MNDEAQAAIEGSELEPTQDPPPEAGSSLGQNGEDIERAALIERAKSYGWKSPDEWKGDPPPSGFRDPEEWVETAEKNLPFLKRELEARDAEISKLREGFAKLNKMSDVALERQKKQHDEQIAAINAAQKRIVESKSGNIQDFEYLEKRKQELMDNAPAASNGSEPQSPDAIFSAENDWYGNDVEMTEFAQHASVIRAKAKPNEPLEQNLAATLEAVKKKFPDRFGEPAPRVIEVEGGSTARPKGGKRTRAVDLPEEAKETMKRDISLGLFKNQAEWLEAYDQE